MTAIGFEPTTGYRRNALKTIFAFSCKGYPSSFGCTRKLEYFADDWLWPLIQDQQAKHECICITGLEINFMSLKVH